MNLKELNNGARTVSNKDRVVEIVALRRVSQHRPSDAICVCYCIYDVIIFYRSAMLLIYDFCN